MHTYKNSHKHTQVNTHSHKCDTGEVENEYHFFSTCPHYISLRKTFLQKVNIKIVNSNISLRHMSLLFNSSLPATLKITVNFLNDCFLMRKAI